MQAAALADAAWGRDLLVSAQTGSGKTVAYGLSVAKNLLRATERFDRNAEKPLALIVAPTGELTLQMQRELSGGAHTVVGTRGGCATICGAAISTSRN